MSVNRDEFFAELDGLTEKEIEEQLATWDMERLTLAQEYIRARFAATEVQPELAEDMAAVRVAMAALRAAKSANTRALAALILAVGAMLTAIVSGLIVVLR
jgi:hypothetical protein